MMNKKDLKLISPEDERIARHYSLATSPEDAEIS
jgi:hypothetical protein